MSPVTIALGGLVALLVLLPTRRLQLAGRTRNALAVYFVIVWALGVLVAVVPVPARLLIPILLIAYIAPFVTLRDGLDRLLGRPPGSGDVPSEAGSRGAGSRWTTLPTAPPTAKDVTPPRDGDR